MTQRLTLIRGLPGSGKSTMAQVLVKENGAKHVEADMFFIKDGEYRFDSAKIKEAHSWCQSVSADALAQGHNVVVSNTFVKQWEMQAYRDMALNQGVELVVLTATGNFNNTHGVPEDVIARMRANWEA